MSDAIGLPPATTVRRRGVFGWMMFDWAAQPFFTVVTTFIFGPYFISRMASDPASGQAAWGYGIAAGGFIIAILSPVLGSIADQTGPRKPWIATFALVKILALCGLWFAAPGSNLVAIVALFTLASVAAEFSIVFNDSMLLRLVPKAQIGRVSNLAWGLGYLGGMIVLIFIIACLAASPETGKTIIGIDPLFGLDPLQGEDARASGPISALWYAIFILPMFFFTPDAGGRRAMGTAIRDGLTELKSTIGEVRQRAGIFRFLIARMIYQDGVNALLALGGGFAAAMFAWSITEIGIYGIMLNVVAIFSCLYASRLDTQLGSKSVVLISIFLLLIATIGIVSTGPGFTFFGGLALGDADSGRPVRDRCGKGLYRLRPADRDCLRSGPGLVTGLHGAQRHRGRGGPLFRHLCPGRARHEFPGALPGRHRHGALGISPARHGHHHPVFCSRTGDPVVHTLPGRPAEGQTGGYLKLRLKSAMRPYVRYGRIRTQSMETVIPAHAANSGQRRPDQWRKCRMPVKHHRDAGGIRCINHILIAHRSARLDHGGRPGFDGGQQPVGKGKERVRGNNTALGERCVKPERLGSVHRLACCDPGRIDPAHLAGADPLPWRRSGHRQWRWT